MKGRLFAALAFCGCGECFGIKAAKGDLVCSDLIYNYLVSMPIKSCSHSRSLACSENVSKAARGTPTPSNLLAFCGMLCSHARYA